MTSRQGHPTTRLPGLSVSAYILLSASCLASCSKPICTRDGSHKPLGPAPADKPCAVDSDIFGWWTYMEYDTEGRLLREYNIQREDQQISEVTYYCHGQRGGLNVETQIQEPEGLYPTYKVTRYQYNQKGLRTRKDVDYGNDGDRDTVTRYRYDDNDRLVHERTVRGDDGDIEDTVSYQYNERGHLVREEHGFQSRSHQSLRVVTHVVDDRGLRIRTEKRGAIRTFTYDRQGRLIREDPLDDGKAYGFYTMHYDAAGRLQKRLWHSPERDYQRETRYRYGDECTEIRQRLHDFPGQPGHRRR